MTERMERTTVGEIVAGDYRAAVVFERFGIDFCCGGRRPFVDACRAAAADPQEVARALEALPPDGEGEADPAEWSVDRVIDYIVTTHHAYVRSSIPVIAAYLAKLSQVQDRKSVV